MQLELSRLQRHHRGHGTNSHEIVQEGGEDAPSLLGPLTLYSEWLSTDALLLFSVGESDGRFELPFWKDTLCAMQVRLSDLTFIPANRTHISEKPQMRSAHTAIDWCL